MVFNYMFRKKPTRPSPCFLRGWGW